MTREYRYMVAWAGDKRSQDALRLGAVLARTFEVGLDLVYIMHVEENTSLQHAGEANFRARAASQARENLEATAAELPEDLSVRVHMRTSSSITQGIVKAAEELNASMIVIGAGSGAGQPVASPIVGALLHASPVPVAMAPRGYRENTFAALTELGKFWCVLWASK